MPGVRAELVACETCGGAARPPGSDGRAPGTLLIERLRAELERRGDIGVDVTPVRCLWACKKSCAVMLRSAGRVGYVIVELTPLEEHARALLDYARLYLDTPDGAVPFKTWPAALRGHFHCRTPLDPGAAARPPEPHSAPKDAAP